MTNRPRRSAKVMSCSVSSWRWERHRRVYSESRNRMTLGVDITFCHHCVIFLYLLIPTFPIMTTTTQFWFGLPVLKLTPRSNIEHVEYDRVFILNSLCSYSESITTSSSMLTTQKWNWKEITYLQVVLVSTPGKDWSTSVILRIGFEQILFGVYPIRHGIRRNESLYLVLWSIIHTRSRKKSNYLL